MLTITNYVNKCSDYIKPLHNCCVTISDTTSEILAQVHTTSQLVILKNAHKCDIYLTVTVTQLY